PGYASAIWQYDHHHHEIERAYFGEDARPIYNAKDHYQRMTRLYDGGRLAEEAYFGVEREPTYREGYARVAFNYDAAGNVVGVRYFGTNGQPVLVTKE